jgi:acyl-coenzyme A synthetase/AMP-(fatty) acid ligase
MSNVGKLTLSLQLCTAIKKIKRLIFCGEVLGSPISNGVGGHGKLINTPGVEIVMKLPLPPGAMTSLCNNNDRFINSYLSRFEGYYLAGDAGYIDDNGYVYIIRRTDDVINTAGHRLSTGAMGEILIKHPDVAECAVVVVADKLKEQIPLGLFTIKTGSK